MMYLIIFSFFLEFLPPGSRYHDEGVPAPYGCHPCESTRLPGHRWRFPPQSMNHWDSMPYRPPFEDAIPVANRGMHSPCQQNFIYHVIFFFLG